MDRKPRTALIGIVALGALLLAGCGDDDAGVTELNETETSGSASASGSGSASGSASGSGINTDELAGTDNPLIIDAVDGYRAYVEAQIDEMIELTTTFTDAIRDGDIEAAQEAYAPSRAPWERVEPIAGLIEDIDVAVDARVDDFDGPDDPTWTGWHRLEYLLWEAEDIADAGAIADQLDADLQALATGFADVELPPGVLTVGAQELIEEVAAPDGKLSGEEDRYSHTDLWDFKANVEGSEELVELLTPALEEADPELLAAIDESFADLDAALAELEEGNGYVSYEDVTEEQKDDLAAILSDLAEELSQLNGALGLE